MKLTPQLLQAAVSGCTLANAEKYAPGLNAAIEKYGINTPLRLAHFLAQIGHESIGFSATRESMNYSVEAILKTFSRARISEADAKTFGRLDKPARPANQSAIANLAYGGAWGLTNLGNTKPGDGWKYRGGGLMQTTGKKNYSDAGRAIGVDLVTNPDLLNVPENATMSAGAFWHSRNLNALADTDSGAWNEADKAVFVAITGKINGGINGIADREARFLRARAALGIPAPLKVPKAA